MTAMIPEPKCRAALFLDRDGVLIEDIGYVGRPEDVILIGGVANTIARINALGAPVVVVSNQSGVARGLFSEDAVEQVHNKVSELLRSSGGRVDRFYFCPHHPTLGRGEYRRESAHRKPAPGMLCDAAVEMTIDLRMSVMVGDKISDIQAGRAVCATTVLVRTGYGRDTETKHERIWDAVYDDLPSAEEFITGCLLRPPQR
jgi:D-glycero-D-manno-heptose 1,7-bisphosphate phosphatase